MPITTSLGGFYKSELDFQRDVFPKDTDPEMNMDADEFLQRRTQTEQDKSLDLDLGLPPEDQTNPMNDVVI